MAGKWEKGLRVKRSADGLNARQRKMIDAWFGEANFNKTRAVEAAGYKGGNKTLARFEHPAVIAEIERRHRAVRERYEVTYERVVEELAKIAFSNIRDYGSIDPDTGDYLIDFRRADTAQLAAIGQVTIEEYMEGRGEDAQRVKRIRLKPYDKLGALDQLMRHAGLSKDKAGTALADIADRLAAGLKRVGKAPEADDGE